MIPRPDLLALSRPWVLAIALALWIVRIPDIFLKPQFWAEDGPIFFQQQYLQGYRALFLPYNGYYHLLQRLIAFAASALEPFWTPFIYCYAAIALALLTSWTLTSPRIQLPNKSLLALSPLLVPHSGEIYGSITGMHWILVLSLLGLVFARSPATRLAQAAEYFWFLLVGLTGPLAAFLIPPLLLQWHGKAGQQEERRRLMAFLLIILACIMIHLTGGFLSLRLPHAGHHPPAPMDLLLLIVRRWIAEMLGAPPVMGWVFSALILLCMARARIYRREMAGSLLFGLGAILATALHAGEQNIPYYLKIPFYYQRHLYLPTVAMFWVFCLLLAQPARWIHALALGAILLTWAANIIPPYRLIRPALLDLDWASHAARIGRDDTLFIPVNPQPYWNIDLSP